MTFQVLVIDDEKAIQMIVKASLELTAGWTVATASSALEGFAKAKSDRPNVILLDVMMPETSGIELFYQLQAEPLTQKIPVVFLTAQVRESEQANLKALGSGVIAKPFEPETIAQQITEILHRT